MNLRKLLLAICFLIAAITSHAQVFYFQVGLVEYGTGTGGSVLTPFVDYFEGNRISMLYKASDLIAAGVEQGPIHSIQYSVFDLDGCGPLENYRISMRNTSVNNLTSYLGGTSVWGPITYQPVLGFNTFVLTTPFTWDGTSNLYIEICKGPTNPSSGNYASLNARVSVSGTNYTAFRGYFADNTANMCTATATNGNTNLIPTVWVGQFYDCIGIIGGPFPPGTPCTDGNACTENDTYQADCQCIGTPLPDNDNDGTCDAQDGCPNDPDKTAPGACGCGNPDTDSDNDGLADCNDACPNDPANDADGDGLCADVDGCPLALNGITNFNEGTCNCDAGYYQVTTTIGPNTVITECTICPPGSYCPDGVAPVPCPAGRYSDLSGQVACIDCAAGSYNDQVGATECVPCAAGAYSSVTGATACVECAAGTYNPSTGATECLACAFDETSIPGATSCTYDLTCTTVLSLDITLPGFTLNGPTYELRRVVNDQLIAEGGGGFMNQGVTPLAFCVPNGSFYLKMNNMVAGARYVLRKAGNPGTRIIDNESTTAGTNRVTEFTVAPDVLSTRGAVQIPIGPAEFLYTSCDKYFWKKGEFIVINEDADVAAEWVPNASNSLQDPTSGYDFWFYDPNGGYSFIRQRRHNQHDGFGNVGSARTCHMQVNNWTSANWIPNQVPLNVRVRAVVNNVPKNWGPACRFMRDDALANCPPTKLMDVPGNPFISCNVFRDFNNQSINRLYARPVSGATKYRFTFTNAELAMPIVREVTTYYLTLGWNAGIAPPLTPGSTYQVTVQAFKGGWCVAGDHCFVNINNQTIGGQQNNSMEGQGNAALKLWPNPNRGDLLNVSLLVPDDLSSITMDLYSLSGARVSTRTISAQDGSVNAVVDLSGDLAAGMYMVNIAAGDRTYTQRLVIQP